jgi:hypothetical protein
MYLTWTGLWMGYGPPQWRLTIAVVSWYLGCYAAALGKWFPTVLLHLLGFEVGELRKADFESLMMATRSFETSGPLSNFRSVTYKKTGTVYYTAVNKLHELAYVSVSCKSGRGLQFSFIPSLLTAVIVMLMCYSRLFELRPAWQNRPVARFNPACEDIWIVGSKLYHVSPDFMSYHSCHSVCNFFNKL